MADFSLVILSLPTKNNYIQRGEQYEKNNFLARLRRSYLRVPYFIAVFRLCICIGDRIQLVR
jgi:hypothetical protein